MKNKKFEEYFQKYQDLIMKIVVDKTGSYDDAEEICQQVFLYFYFTSVPPHSTATKPFLSGVSNF